MAASSMFFGRCSCNTKLFDYEQSSCYGYDVPQTGNAGKASLAASRGGIQAFSPDGPDYLPPG
jgi:hypothetical protein